MIHIPCNSHSPLSLARTILLLFVFPILGSSQTKWFKYEGNPVFDTGPAGTWDATWIHIDRVIREGSVYRMWYTAGDTARIGHATSRDGVTWTRDRSNPVLDITRGSWESNVHRGYVIFAGSKYHMWYTGDDWSTFHIDYASSVDGIVWKKLGRPVLSPGPPTSWDKDRVGLVSVVGPDTLGGFKMWYEVASTQYFGYATATDETTWTKNSNPVFWDNDIVYYPRVIFDGRLYEMWYSVSPPPKNALGYATSLDGINWTKSLESPVLHPGPDGTWDDAAIGPTGDVIFDGTLYNMWYTGNDGSDYRGGYAVSPRNMQINISPSYAFLSPQSGVVRIEVKVENPTALSFSAKIKAPKTSAGYPEDRAGLLGLEQVDLLELYDDGLHGDSLAGDRIFANSWIPTEEKLYFVDLKLRVQREKALSFEMNKATVFTTIGPLLCEGVEFLPNRSPHPGDTVLAKLFLRNHGSSAIAHSVTASLSSEDPAIREITQSSQRYGDVIPGNTSTTAGYYRIAVSPYAPADADVKMDVAISSWGIELWRDSFTLHIVPPWWRTTWAYAGYGVVVLALYYSFRRFEKNRERLKHQAELEHLEAEKLREVDQLKSRFFANISHEFRTPLTLILGPIEKWKKTSKDEDLQKDLGMMHRNARRLLRLISQLLDISKLEAGSMKLQASPGNIVSFAKGIAYSFQSVAANKRITLRTESDREQIEVYFDRDKMEKILSNLLSNAFKFTAEGGGVSLSLRTPPQGGVKQSDSTNGQIASSSHQMGTLLNGKQAGVVEITISDTGIGIPPEQLPHIFDRFYQVDGSHTREQEGTGIGLALAKELVELHDGTIVVKSELGKGTQCIVQLPLGRAHLKDDEVVEKAEEEGMKATEIEASSISEVIKDLPDKKAEPAEQKPIILIVEDNADVRSYVREYLDPLYETLESSDGEDGIKTALESIPDLMICDVMMPRKDGFEVCRVLKTDRRTSHIPIILLTAKAGMESKIEGLETGADDYLVKPFDATELLVRVKNLIEQRRRLREKFRHEVMIRPSDVAATSLDETFLLRVKETVEKNIRNEHYSVDQLADEVGLSYTQLHRKLRALTNMSTGQFVRWFRLQRAMKLLKKNAGTVGEIAYSVGFGSPAYFTKCFKEEFGFLPSEAARRDEA